MLQCLNERQGITNKSKNKYKMLILKLKSMKSLTQSLNPSKTTSTTPKVLTRSHSRTLKSRKLLQIQKSKPIALSQQICSILVQKRVKVISEGNACNRVVSQEHHLQVQIKYCIKNMLRKAKLNFSNGLLYKLFKLNRRETSN